MAVNRQGWRGPEIMIDNDMDQACQQIERQMRSRLERDAMEMFDDLIAQGAAPERASAEVSRFCTVVNGLNQAIVAILRREVKTMARLDADALESAAGELQRKLDALQPRSRGGLDWRRL